MNNIFKTLFILSLALVAPNLFAVDMRIQTSQDTVTVSSYFLADVLVDSDQSINALEGILIYPLELLTVKEIRDGDSVMNFWIESPKENTKGKIAFGGITPGGFSGKNNPVFSVLFEAKNVGEANLAFQEVKVLLNDGEGTEVPIFTTGKVVSINSEGQNNLMPELRDTEIPEDFTPILAHDPNLFDDKYFLVFSTKDKISGIDRYELREGRAGTFKKVVSPYLLEYQSLSKKIFIRAIDKSGNVREVIFDPEKENSLYKNKLMFGIIILLVAVILFVLRKKLWKKSTS